MVFFLITILKGYGRTETGNDSIRTKNVVHFDYASFLYIGMYAINYEQTIYQTNHNKISATGGIGQWYLTTISQWNYGYSVPVSFNFLRGSGNNFFETNLGIRYTFFNKKSDKNISPYYPVFNLGYRYQKPEGKGLIIRVYIGLSGFGAGVGKAF